MAALETGIREAIKGDASIAALVGSRIRPLGVAPYDLRPYLTYEITGRTTEGTLNDGPADYRKAEFEIGVYGDTYSSVVTLSDLTRNRLDQFGGTVAGIEFAPCEFDSETDVEQATPEGEEKPVYLRVQTYRTLYKAV